MKRLNFENKKNISERKNLKSRFVLTFLFFMISSLSFAFDWPNKNREAGTIISNFGQYRGGTLETSIIFQGQEEVYSSEAGKVILQINESDDAFSGFNSTLGNALILSHAGDIYTVYSNLEKDSLADYSAGAKTLIKGSYLGLSGKSAWKRGQAGLDFQILDLKNKTAINPKLVLPRTGRERKLTIENLFLQDKNGKLYKLDQVTSLPSESYRIYKNRQTDAVPFETSLSVNGYTVDTISYDSIHEHEGRLCLTGKNEYYAAIIYPDSEKQFLASTRLYRGKNVIAVTLKDITGRTKTTSFEIDVY